MEPQLFTFASYLNGLNWFVRQNVGVDREWAHRLDRRVDHTRSVVDKMMIDLAFNFLHHRWYAKLLWKPKKMRHYENAWITEYTYKRLYHKNRHIQYDDNGGNDMRMRHCSSTRKPKVSDRTANCGCRHHLGWTNVHQIASWSPKPTGNHLAYPRLWALTMSIWAFGIVRWTDKIPGL